MKKLTLYAPAKINLGLEILGRRPDGFHVIHSLMIPIPLNDVITMQESASFEFHQEDNLGFPPEKNLIFTIAKKFLAEFKISSGISIKLEKKIPSGAGLGGGSSDAAATLLGLKNFFDIENADEKIFDLAAEAGSDVPFFLLKSPAIADGRGEILRQVEFSIPGSLAVVMPNFSINTTAAYRDFDIAMKKFGEEPHSAPTDYAKFLPVITEHPQLMKTIFRNAFVFDGMRREEEIRLIISKLYHAGAMFASMSGSESACFGIFPHEKDISSIENLFAPYRIFLLKM